LNETTYNWESELINISDICNKSNGVTKQEKHDEVLTTKINNIIAQFPILNKDVVKDTVVPIVQAPTPTPTIAVPTVAPTTTPDTIVSVPNTPTKVVPTKPDDITGNYLILYLY